LILRAQKGLAPESADSWQEREAGGTAAYGLALARGEPIVVPDVEVVANCCSQFYFFMDEIDGHGFLASKVGEQ
jgi:hypothetical protein